jgi:undecaprenyl-diphosphatase
METVTAISRGLPMIILASAAFGWFFWKKQRAEYMVLEGAILSFAINPVLKFLVDRPRPTEDMVIIWGDPAGMGFPSGHAIGAMVIFGVPYYLAPMVMSWSKIVPWMRYSFVTLIILIGISRVYLGAHWPSDVLDGFLAGGIMLYLLIQLHRQYSPQLEPPPAIWP